MLVLIMALIWLIISINVCKHLNKKTSWIYYTTYQWATSSYQGSSPVFDARTNLPNYKTHLDFCSLHRKLCSFWWIMRTRMFILSNWFAHGVVVFFEINSKMLTSFQGKKEHGSCCRIRELERKNVFLFFSSSSRVGPALIYMNNVLWYDIQIVFIPSAFNSWLWSLSLKHKSSGKFKKDLKSKFFLVNR